MRTWSRPLQLATDSPTGAVQGSIPAVAPDGTVFVLFGRRIFGGPVKGRLEIAKSANGGASFNQPTLAANITAIPFFLPNGLPNVNFRTPASLPAFVVSPADGNLYAAWADYRHNDADIFLARSVTGGRTWDVPVRLNDDPVGNGVDQIQPQLAVAPNGRVAVSWHDRRLPCPDLPWIDEEHVGQANTCIDTFMTRSHDGGATWEPNIRVSAQTWDWRLNLPIADPSGSTRTGFIGDYLGLASSNDYDYPVWAATANLGDNGDNRQQIFVARVAADWLPPTVTPTVIASPSATASSTATSTSTTEPEPSASATPTASATPSPTPSVPSPTTATPTSPPTAAVEPTPTSGGDRLYLPVALSGLGVE